MNHANICDLTTREALLHKIETYTNEDRLDHHASRPSHLIFKIDGYDFQYSYGSIRIVHSWLDKTISDDFCLRGINKVMRRDLIFYEIPYLVHFYKTHTFNVRIVKLDLIDDRDPLVEALLI